MKKVGIMSMQRIANYGSFLQAYALKQLIEELGCEVSIEYLSGVYYHSAVNSHAFMFKCTLQSDQPINLSDEHSEYRWFDFDQL